MATLSELTQCLRDVREFLDNTPGGLGDACAEAADRLAALDALMPRIDSALGALDHSGYGACPVCQESEGETWPDHADGCPSFALRDLLALR